MRRSWKGLGFVCAALVGAGGCWTTESALRPPRPPEEFTVPPENDARFSAPPSFPKGTLFNESIKKPAPGGLPSGPQGIRRPGVPAPGLTTIN